MVDNTPFTVYCDYLALKRHFTSSYDYVKYSGKVNVKYSAFEARQDRYQFEKLSRKRDPHGRMVASLSRDPDRWVGDIIEDEDVYNEVKRTVRSMDYVLREDVKKLDLDRFDSNFTVVNGEHPPLLKQVLRREVCWESFIVMDDVLRFRAHWDREIRDELVWPTLAFRTKKYSSFVSVDRYKYKAVLLGMVNEHTS
jgi:hypothetical protein